MCRHRDVEFMSGFRARRRLVGVAMTTKRHGDAVHRPGKPVEDRFEDRHESVGPGSITMLGPSDAPVDATDRCNPIRAQAAKRP